MSNTYPVDELPPKYPRRGASYKVVLHMLEIRGYQIAAKHLPSLIPLILPSLGFRDNILTKLECLATSSFM